MTDKELRKLGRSDLLELLLAQSKENESLKEQLAAAEEKLNTRRIELAEAGSIADAALALNGVFAAAQAAADQYLETIRQNAADTEGQRVALEAETKAECQRLLTDAKEKAEAKTGEADRYHMEITARCITMESDAKDRMDALVSDTEERCAAMKAQAEEECAALKDNARAEAEAYWQNVSARLEKFYEEHRGLKELLDCVAVKEI